MCDTIIALHSASADGSVLFAKNSDREPNEAQNVTFIPSREHPKSSRVRCTFIEIPQVEKTYAAVLSRPFWMFGAEMGVNECGVVIGNEAVFTKEKYLKKNVLTGMDLLRLGLERSRTARGAHDVIIDLLGQYGQGGNCSMDGKLFYHNSFLIADSDESYVLETAGNHWVSKKVTETWSISNCLTIGEDYDFHSDGIEEHAFRSGYLKKGKALNFSRDFSDRLYTHFAGGLIRRTCSSMGLKEKRGTITTHDMMSMLRDHNSDEEYYIGKKPMHRICMHAGGLISSQSTGSMVVKLMNGKPPLAFITGTSAPCLSLYKPFVLMEGSPSIAENHYTQKNQDGSIDIFGSATNRYDPAVLWWRGEEIHRRVLLNYPLLSRKWQKDIESIEKEKSEDIENTWKKNDAERSFTLCKGIGDGLISFFDEKVEAFKKEFSKSPVKKKIHLFARIQWDRFNKKSGFSISGKTG